MNRASGLGGALARAVAVCVGVAATAPTLAWADSGLPPPEYNIGGATEGDTLRLINAAEDVWVEVIKVPIGEVFAVCDAKTRDHLGVPYPAEQGKTLVGCLVPAGDYYDHQTLVYPDDPSRPWLTHQILLHEAGHLMGWPGDHRR